MSTGISSPSSAAGTPRISNKRRQQLLDLIDGLDVLPTSLAVPMRVLQLQRSQTAGLGDFAEALSSDAGMAAKVLSIANSAAFSPAKPVTKLTVAVSMIGLKNLMPLALGLSMSGIFNRLAVPSDDRAVIFKTSLLKAVAARELAALVSPDEAEEAYLCGLLQDLALPALCAVDRAAWPEYLAALDTYEAGGIERELQMFGDDHAAFGARLARRLAVPDLICDAIGAHHGGVAALRTARCSSGLARAIDAAAAIPHRFTAPNQALGSLATKFAAFAPPAGAAADANPPAAPAPAGTAATPASGAAGILKTIVTSYSNVTRLLGDADERSVVFKTFVTDLSAEIAHRMEAAVCESASVISALKSREAELLGEVGQLKQDAERSDQDALTQVLSRRPFMARATRLLATVRKHRSPCLVGYVDVDNFKLVNDLHGHAAGDAALRSVGARLAKICHRRGFAGRMGGDEFVFLIATKPGAAGLEHEIFTQTLSRFRVAEQGINLDITTSIGMLLIAVPGPDDTAETVLARADRVMYEVKRSGKGRCHISVDGGGPATTWAVEDSPGDAA